MAWPRLRKPRSSAPPVAHGRLGPGRKGLHVIVTPADDAGLARKDTRGTGNGGAADTGINGVSGARPAGAPEAARLEGLAGGLGYDGLSDDAALGFDDDSPGFADPGDPGFAEHGFEDGHGPGAEHGFGYDEFDVRELEEPPGAGIDEILGPAAGPASGAAAAEPRFVPSGTADELASPASARAPAWSAPEPVVMPAPDPDADVAGAGGAGGTAGQRPQRVRDLTMDARMRIWRRRALITMIAGVVFAIMFTWRLGLTIAVLVALADTIYRSRTVASIPPGIKLTGAQRRTQRQLARAERAGYRALHSRPIPDSPDFIDHLVVGPTGVYAIDSDAWDKRLPIRTRNARQLWHGPTSMKDRLMHAQWEAQQAAELLSRSLREEVVVRPAMAVYGPRIPWDIATIRDVDVFSGPRLRKYLRRRARTRDLPRLSEADVEKIHKAAAVVLPLAGSTVTTTPVG